MKTLLKIAEMMPFLPDQIRQAVEATAKASGQKVDDLELHRHSHSEKAKVNELDPSSRKSLAYVSARTQDRDDEIVIPSALELKEFRKYGSVLVNHNYSLLPVGSDDWIEADDFGIKALTSHADTGEGTLANVVWHLVRQGHLKGRSVGFVPTSYTKPGARDWDHVTNQLQSNWKEFSKARAEKSLSRIITGGVLLEHSFVSVPCNTDAEMIGVVKGMGLSGVVLKQLGWEDAGAVRKEMEDEGKTEPCACDRCGRVAEAADGARCPEGGCLGKMRPKRKEKAVELSEKGDTASPDTPLVPWPDQKPYPSEHAARQQDPDKYKRFARQNDKFGEGIHAIFGVTDDKKTELQAVRFDKEKFTPAEAKKWLEEHDMKATVEAAKEEEKSVRVVKGDAPGHPFRGNQYTDGGGGEGGQAGGEGGSAKLPPKQGEIRARLDKEATIREAREITNRAQMRSAQAWETHNTEASLEDRFGKHEAALLSHRQAAWAYEKIDKVDMPKEQLDTLRAKEDYHKEQALRHDKELNRLWDQIHGKKTVKVVRPPVSVKVIYAPPDPGVVLRSVSDAVERAISRRTGRLS